MEDMGNYGYTLFRTIPTIFSMLSVYICPKGLQRIARALKKERRAAHTPFVEKSACYSHPFALSKDRTK